MGGDIGGGGGGGKPMPELGWGTITTGGKFMDFRDPARDWLSLMNAPLISPETISIQLMELIS